MKIDQHGLSGPAASAEIVRLDDHARHAPTRGVEPGGDAVTLSADAQFVHAAFDEAMRQPEVREDVVERMRELDARGELGANADRLADAILEAWMRNE